MVRRVQCIVQVRRENSSRNSISPIKENCQCFNLIRHSLPDDRERRNSKNIRSAKSRHHIARNVLPHSQESNTACRFRTAQTTKGDVSKLIMSDFFYRPGDKRHKTQKSKFEIFCPEIAHGMPIHLVYLFCLKVLFF